VNKLIGVFMNCTLKSGLFALVRVLIEVNCHHPFEGEIDLKEHGNAEWIASRAKFRTDKIRYAKTKANMDKVI